MIKILLTIIFISIPVFAVDSIYAWGYGEDIKNILQSIKFFTGNATYLIDSAIVIGLLMITYKETKEDNTDKIAKVIFISLLVSQMFFHSTKDYMVEDEVTNQAFAVTNVPIGIGELYSLFSTLERVMTHAFESSFSTPNSLNFSQVGLGFSMNAHLGMQKATFANGYAHETFMDYTTNCIASGMLDHSISPDLVKSENILQAIRVEGYETLVTKPNGTIEQMSCQDSYDNYITSYATQEVNDFIHYKLVSELNIEQDKKLNALKDTSTLFTGVSADGQTYATQFMIRNMLKKGFQVMAMTTGGDTQALAYGSAVSEASLNNQWQQSGMMAQSTLPMIKAYLTSIILAMTPVLALLAIMFGDWKHIKMIITLLITLMLFSPMATVINFLIYSKLERILPLMNEGLWMPMVASGSINQMLLSYLNFLGYAAMSIPILSYSLVKASEQGFVSFMSGMGGSVSGAANTGASQKTTGVNIGNTKVAGSTVTNENGTTSNLGGGLSTNKSAVGNEEIGMSTVDRDNFKDGTTQASLSNKVADVGLSNGEIVSASSKNFDGAVSQQLQSNKTEAIAKENSANEQLSVSSGKTIADAISTGTIKSDGETLNNTFGTNASSVQSAIKSANESHSKDINSRWNDAHSIQEKQDLAASLGMSVATPKIVDMISGFKVGADGKITASAGEGKDISFSMSAGESKNYQEALANNISKSLAQSQDVNYGIAKSIQDNEVLNNSTTKQDMENYSNARSTAVKATESYNQSETQGSNFNKKILPDVYKDFIDNDERLSYLYNSGDLKASDSAVSEATYRVNDAIMNPNKHQHDAKIVDSAIKDALGIDVNSELASNTSNQIQKVNSEFENMDEQFTSGKNSISNTPIESSSNENLKNEFDEKKANLAADTSSNIDKFVDSNSKYKDTIDNTEEYLKEKFNDKQDDSRAVSVIGGLADTGTNEVGALVNGISNIPTSSTELKNNQEHQRLVNDTWAKAEEKGLILDDGKSINPAMVNDNMFSLDELKMIREKDINDTGDLRIGGLNNQSEQRLDKEIEFREKGYNSSDFTDNYKQDTYNKAQDIGLVADEFGADNLQNINKLDQFSTKELTALTEFDGVGTNGLTNNAKETINQEISDMKNRIHDIQDELEDQVVQTQPQIKKKG